MAKGSVIFATNYFLSANALNFKKKKKIIFCLLHESLIIFLTLYSIDFHFDTSQQTAFKNIVGKGEITHNEQFLLFPQYFLRNQILVFPFVHIFDIISLFAAELEEP